MWLNEYQVTLSKNESTPHLRNVNALYLDDMQRVTNPDDVVTVMKACRPCLTECADEYVYCLCLNVRGKPIGFFEVSHGGGGYAAFPVKEIFRKALLAGAMSIVLVHNHPSGDPTPSSLDVEATKKIVEAGRLLELEVHDHIVISKGTYAAIKDTNHELWEVS